MTELRFNY